MSAKPFFLFTQPRSGGTALQRMLDLSTGMQCAPEAWDWLSKLKALEEVPSLKGETWGRVVAGESQTRKVEPRILKELLESRVGLRAGVDHYGVRSTLTGSGGWEEASGIYSWLLRTWPEGVLVFLLRGDEVALEISLEATWPVWIPQYGSCNGNVLARARQQGQWMRDFAEMNPARCVVVTTEEMESYEALAGRLATVNLPLDRMAWEAMDQTRPGCRRELRDEMENSMVTRGDDPWEGWEEGMPEPEMPVDEALEARLFAELDRQQARIEREKDWRTLPMDGELRLKVPEPSQGHGEGTVIYTLRYGEQPWMEECAGSLEEWVTRHGMELRVWEKPGAPDPKHAVVEMLREFVAGPAARMIYVDADVFVHPLAPVMEELPGLAIMVDVPWRQARNAGWETWCKNYYPGLEAKRWRYRNAGVWSVTKEAARQMLEVIEPPFIQGSMEQDQWNVWLLKARERGMLLTDLPEAWNTFASQRKAGWFHHLAGRGCKVKKLGRLRDLNLLPRRPEHFEPRQPSAERAICYLWKSTAAKWDELRYSLRSVRANFEDCPEIHIFGDARPEWLEDGAGVTFHYKPGYAAALAAAVQQAKEVVLWNDDIYCLRRTSWDDLRVALTRKKNLVARMSENLASANRWFRSVGRATSGLYHRGFNYVRDFSTHTPYLFEREKSLATLRKHGVWYKVPFEVLYHNDHGTPHRRCGDEKTMRLPCHGEPRWLNHGSAGPAYETGQALKLMFPDAAPWEKEGGFIPGRRGTWRWFDYQDVYQMIVDEAPEGATIVEVGVWEGGSLGYLADYAAYRGKRLRIIGYDGFHLQNGLGSPGGRSSEEWEAYVRGNLAQGPELSRAEVVRSDSAGAARNHEDGSVFAVWIDADHSEKAVKRDLDAWLPKVMKGGIFAGHDLPIRGVARALRAKRIPVIPISQRSWMMQRTAPMKTAAVFQAVGGKLPHLLDFQRWNPGVEVHVIERPKLAGEELATAWHHGDRPMMEWWEKTGRHTDAERVIFLEWDVKFSARVGDVFPPGEDFMGPDVHVPGDGWGWWREIELLPEGLRDHAKGIAPLAVLMFSRRCLEAMRVHPLAAEAMGSDAFCELRVATLATAAGYPPKECPGLREVNLHEKDPGDRPGVWHPVKG